MMVCENGGDMCYGKPEIGHPVYDMLRGNSPQKQRDADHQ